MHVAEPLMNGDTANLIHVSNATDTRQHIPSLLLQPVWTSEHLKLLRVKERVEIATASIVGKFNLPRDGHNDFEELASDLAQATPQDLLDFANTKDKYRLNMFWRVFSDLYEMIQFKEGRISQNRYVRSAKSAVHCLVETILPYVDDEGSLRIELNSLPFHLSRIAVKGILTCDGCIIKTDMESQTPPQPVTAFSVLRPQQNHNKNNFDIDIEAQEASQLVLQAALKYEQNPHLTNYKSYVIHINHTNLQLVSADISRAYIEELYQGRMVGLSDGFEVLHSMPCDMVTVEGRREALRMIFGLLKSLRSKSMRRPF